MREELILKAYSNLKYVPRDNQVSIIDKVLIEYFDNHKKNVILCLDTGSGKSIIAAVISECIRILTEPKITSFILMHQNSLVDQYSNSFKDLSNYTFAVIKGAGQYPCINLQKKFNNKVISADECVKEHMSHDEIKKQCNGCEFLESRKYINNTQNLITNYSYFFISKLWSEHIENRDFHIFDEAHILNEIFSDHCSIYVSEKRLSDFIEELKKENKSVFNNDIESLDNLRKEILYKQVNHLNYESFLTKLNETYIRLANEYESMMEEAEDLAKKVIFSRKYKKYFNLKCKIGDYFFYRYECVYDGKDGEEFTVKPIFIKDMIDVFLSKYNLFMSATITEDFCYDTFGLKESETAFISEPPIFSRENRPIFFLGNEYLNHKNMSTTDTLKYILQVSRKIVDEIHKEDKGIILTPSFKVNEIIAHSLKSVKVFEHTRGMNTNELITEFKEYEHPAVLISPSLYEGLDLYGDNSRYQIVVKTPYASLGDKRISYIAEKYPHIYKMATLFKILQGIGRSVRSIDDYAYSYFLDKGSQSLYNSTYNIWKERYKV